MRIFSRDFLKNSALMLGAALLGTNATAQTFPTKPLRLVVPFAAGNSTDVIARLLAENMRKELGQTIVVENKTGASGIIAATFVATQPADAHTLLLASDSTMVLNPLLYKKLSYNPDRDLTSVGAIADVPLVMTINPALPVNNLAEFVAYAQKNPSKLNFGSTGTGGAFHLAGELFKQMANVEMTHIPYPGGAPATSALLAGDIQVLFGVVGSLIPHIKSGKLRALAIATKERVPVLPHLPTIAESYPGYEATVRYGLVVRKGAPAESVAKLNDALNKSLVNPAFRTQFEEQGYIVYRPHPPGSYSALIEKDKALWGKVIRSHDISLE